MHEPVLKLETRKLRLEIFPDDGPESPREWSNLGTMAFFHKRYDLGDKDHGINANSFNSWDEMEKYVWEELKAAVVMPVYMYDHGGLAFSTSRDNYPFNDRWDSGRLGLMFVTKETVRKEYPGEDPNNLSPEKIAKIKDILTNELKVYAQYVEGDVYGFQVTDKKTGDCIESCWGFYGSDWKANGITEHISSPTLRKMLAAA